MLQVLRERLGALFLRLKSARRREELRCATSMIDLFAEPKRVHLAHSQYITTLCGLTCVVSPKSVVFFEESGALKCAECEALLERMLTISP